MSQSSARLSRIGICYGIGLAVVLAHYVFVMVFQHEQWLVRSYRNRWAFRDVPSIRGTLRDRYDRVLAEDAPTFELSCVYNHFRLLHPVGAAVHGATTWTGVRDGTATRFSYEPGVLGPERACRELFAMPCGVLVDGEVDKDTRGELAHAVGTVIARCSGIGYAKARRALRDVGREHPALPVGRALAEVDEATLCEQFGAVLRRLYDLDRALGELDARRRAMVAGASGGQADEGDEDDGVPQRLVRRLDRFRVDSIAGLRTRGDDGYLLDLLARPVLRNVPFELAAAVRLAADDQPGLRLEPALQRMRPDLDLPTLEAILGGVVDVDRATEEGAPEQFVERQISEVLEPGIEDLVPDELAPSPELLLAWRDEARWSYKRAVLARERLGSGGLERQLDERLGGAPGIRLVEHDARAREQKLWSSLRVQAGSDVALTVDLDLQRVVERLVADAAVHWQQEARQRDYPEDRIDVAFAIVDARSGDVLALSGAPARLGDKRRIPAVLSWRGNGAIGSLFKPLALAESLIAQREGRLPTDQGPLQECRQHYRTVGGRRLSCDHSHGSTGLDPVAAVARSCNTFFFQVAERIGENGLRRAGWRFGMLEVGGGDGRFQPRPAELPDALCAAPQFTESDVLQMRGIGYATYANPLSLARAYAALATGELPTLGFVRDEMRPRHALGLTPEEHGIVVRGLIGCVEYGTAKELTVLRSFGVAGKTGTAEVQLRDKIANNAWFAGFLSGPEGEQPPLAFCAVVYAVPDKTHGADAAGELVEEWLQAMHADATLAERYLPRGSGR